MTDSNVQTPPPSANPGPARADVIKQISQTLVKRRKDRDLTLEKVAQIIKIRLPYLQSLESGAWEELPGEVYVRGFLKRYADFLGLDPVALMAPYLASQSPVVEPAPAAATPLSTEMNRLQFLWIGVIGIFIVVFIKLIQKERSAPLKPAAVASSTTTVAVVTSVAPVVTPEVPAARAAIPKHTLQIYSPFPLWLRVTAADRNFEGFIPQASSWSWKGEGTFKIRFGHTKQVVLSFDGQPVPLVDDQKGITLPHED
jgi:transcriptional regulator with XRE-family HTH domain